MERDSTTRIGIVGAGCAGLTVAEELRGKGYEKITILEAKQRPGGKAYSRKFTDTNLAPRGFYEAGTAWFIPGPLYRDYARRFGLSRAYDVRPPAKVLELSTGRISSPYLIRSNSSVPKRLSQLARFIASLYKFAKPSAPGFYHQFCKDHAAPSREWFDEHGFEFAREALIPVANGAQFGHVEPETPFIYVAKFLALLTRYRPHQQLTLALPAFAEGNQELWRRVAKSHEVLYAETIQNITRGTTVRVETNSGTHEFDRLVWTAPIEGFLDTADTTDEETSIFSGVKTIHRAVITCKIDGLPKDAFYFVKETLNRQVPETYPHVFYAIDSSSQIYNFYPYMNESTSLTELENQIDDLVGRLGGRNIRRVESPIYWRWFPHFSSDDIRSGVYERIERLQGNNNTFFAGEIVAGVAITYGMEYAAHLVHDLM
jgi:protoporphyrinogen oxidase